MSLKVQRCPLYSSPFNTGIKSLSTVLPSFISSSSPKTCFLSVNILCTLETKPSGFLNKILLPSEARVQSRPISASGVEGILNKSQNLVFVSTTFLFSSSSKTPL